jgi:2-polyprenyl-3-methyl-5-hydroxy-6-metoxy-1,4-benzoquinol methylase
MATRERQYNIPFEDYYKNGPVKLGFMTSHVWRTDPKRLAFLLARYKFVSKMLSGCGDVLEVGCGDGVGAEIVLQEVKKLHCVDFDPMIIAHCAGERPADKRISFEAVDLRKDKVKPARDAVYALDVLEHISRRYENIFIKNLAGSIKEDGICIIGMPSIESQAYASKWSKEGHVNCKSGEELKTFLNKYFKTVFLFSMNDEVVHTGFYPMAHYLLAVCACPKKPQKGK